MAGVKGRQLRLVVHGLDRGHSRELTVDRSCEHKFLLQQSFFASLRRAHFKINEMDFLGANLKLSFNKKIFFAWSLLLWSSLGLVNVSCSDILGKSTSASDSGVNDKLKIASVCYAVPMASQSDAATYCVRPNAKKSVKRVIYFFHGFGGMGDDFFAAPMSDFVLDMEKYSAESPLLVGISVGPQKMLNAAIAQEVVERVIPEIEAQFGLSGKITRQAIGMSMGGHNVLRLIAQKPIFSMSYLLCPGIMYVDPFDNQALQAYVSRHNIDKPLFNTIMGSFREQFPTRVEWEKNNPFVFLKNGAYDIQSITMSVGTSDTLGFDEGVADFARISYASRGNYIDVYGVPGGHCAFNMMSLKKKLLY